MTRAELIEKAQSEGGRESLQLILDTLEEKLGNYSRYGYLLNENNSPIQDMNIGEYYNLVSMVCRNAGIQPTVNQPFRPPKSNWLEDAGLYEGEERRRHDTQE